MYAQRGPIYPAAPPAVSSASLLGQVLGITGVGFVITAIAAYLFRGISPGAGFLAFLGGFGLLIAMQLTRRNAQTALLLFYAFTFLEGIGLAPTIARYVANFGPDIVVNAAGTTGLGMVVLGLVVWATSFDFRRLAGIAFGLLIALVIVGLVSIFFHFLSPGVYAWATLGVFTLLTLIDFSRIKAGGDYYSPVDIAVSIYLDAINIFLALLQIFGLRSRDD